MADFDYTTNELVKAELELGSGAIFPSDHDRIIDDMIEQASRLIDDYKGVEIGAYKTADVSVDETRYYFGSGLTEQFVDFITNLTSVAVEETDGTYTTWTIDTDFYTMPANAAQIGEPIRRLVMTRKTGSSKSVWTYGYNRIKIVGKFGIASAIPAQIARACLIQTQRWYQRTLQGWNDSGGAPDLGEMTFVKELDPDVKRIMNSAFPHVSRIAV